MKQPKGLNKDKTAYREQYLNARDEQIVNHHFTKNRAAHMEKGNVPRQQMTYLFE